MIDQPVITLNDGRPMPQIGLGLWQAPDDEAARVIRDAVAAGYRAVDTAMFYHNERGVGEGLRSVETPVHLTTKLWNDDQGYDNTLRAFEASLKRLGRESVDLYLIHWPAQKRGLYVETWKALIRCSRSVVSSSSSRASSPFGRSTLCFIGSLAPSAIAVLL